MQEKYTALMRQIEAYRDIDPLLYLRGLAIAKSFGDSDLRFVRAGALHTLATKLHGAMAVCDFQNEIVLRPEGVFVNFDGILMESSHTPLYLKNSGPPSGHLGRHVSRTLGRMNISVSTAVDVGKNFGELSLWLARECPKARIVAIEPSSDNLSVFERNRKAQSFSTEHIEVIQRAISDRSEVAAIQKGASPMSRVVAPGDATGTEAVQCERLDVLFDRLGIKTADFVKIDIEGGEPKVKEALMALGERVRSYYIEFSQFAPLADYLALASALIAGHFACYDETASLRLNTAEEIAGHLRTAFAPGKIAVTNLWFIAER